MSLKTKKLIGIVGIFAFVILIFQEILFKNGDSINTPVVVNYFLLAIFVGYFAFIKDRKSNLANRVDKKK